MSLFILHRRPNERVFACVDGNCRVCFDDATGGLIGTILDAPMRHSFVSEAMVGFCKAAGLMVANTFSRVVKEGCDQGSLFDS